MHIITQKRIREAVKQFPECETSLISWYRLARLNNFSNFAELKNTFNSVDKAGDIFIFNLAGNKLRLITYVSFVYKKIYIKEIITHSEYNKRVYKH